MTRLRLGPALLAAMAVVGVTLPLGSLFTPNDWARPTLAVILVITCVGALGRWLTRHVAAVAALQTALAIWACVNLLLRDTTQWTLPTRTTLGAAVDLLGQAHSAILRSAAPVPLEPGITLAIVLVVCLLAVVVDVTAVSMRMPAAAGLPLLAAYVASAANSGTGLATWYFLLPAAAWVALLGHDALDRLQRWGGSIARPGGGVANDPRGAMLTMARLLAGAGLAAAVILPGVLPHFPPTFIGDGLGQAAGARGGGADSLGTTLDVARNLQQRSETTIFTYTTSVSSPPPLRVDVLTRYEDGEWKPSEAAVFDTSGQLPTPDQARSAVSSTTSIPTLAGSTTVEGNVLKRPQLAIPGVPVGIELPAAAWRVDANALPRLLEDQERYTVRWQELAPVAGTFGLASGDFPGAPTALAIDPRSEPMVLAVLDKVAPVGLSPAETAWRIQSYLRSGQFSYSTDLAPVVTTGSDGQTLSTDAVTQFLVSRRGYCVQFATTMALMARERGIPSRVAVGFLPGSLNRTTWTVRGKDAHAWPELWFPETGWLRFDPTPGVQSGLAPPWTLSPGARTPTASPSASPSAASERPDPQAAATPGSSTDAGALAIVARWVTDHGLLLASLVAIALSLALVPLGAAVGRRHALRTAADDPARVEVLWEAMLSRLGDVGVEPAVGDTPRQAGRRLASAAYLDDPAREALGSVVAILEDARYAPTPHPDLQALHAATTLVVHSAQRRRTWWARLRAHLWPEAGRAAWLRVLTRLGRMPAALRAHGLRNRPPSR